MPWTSGKASAECEALQQDRWGPIIVGALKAFGQRRTLFFLAGYALAVSVWVFIDAVAPVLAVQRLGMASDGYSAMMSASTLAAGIACIVMSGPLIRRFGLREVLAASTGACALMAIVGALTVDGWQGDTAFTVLLCAKVLIGNIMFVALSACAMRITVPAVAASQFALFNAIPNFGRSTMSGSSGWIVESYGYAATYLAVALLVGLGLGLLIASGVGRSADVRKAAEGAENGGGTRP